MIRRILAVVAIVLGVLAIFTSRRSASAPCTWWRSAS